MKKTLLAAFALACAYALPSVAAQYTLLQSGQQNNSGTSLAAYPLYSGMDASSNLYWGDGQNPHADADYVVGSGLSMFVPVSYTIWLKLSQRDSVAWGDHPFKGKSLTIADGGTLRMQGNSSDNATAYALNTKNIILAGGGKIYGTDNGVQGIRGGTITIQGTSANPSLIQAGWSGSGKAWRLRLDSGLVGEASSALKIHYPAACEIPTRVEFLGDNSGMKGTIQVGQSMFCTVGSDMANATIETVHNTAHLSITNAVDGTPFKIGGLKLTDGASFEGRFFVNAPNGGYAVQSTYSQVGVTTFDLANIELSANTERVVFFRVAKAAGTPVAGNFAIANAASDKYSVKCVTEGESTVVAVYNGNYEKGPDLPATPTSFITMTKCDSWNAGQQSYFTGYGWSDGNAPHAGGDYKVSGSSYYLSCRQSDGGKDPFGGDSLTLDNGGALYLWWNTTKTEEQAETLPVTIATCWIGAGGIIRGEHTSSGHYSLYGQYVILANTSNPAILRPSLTNSWFYMRGEMMGASAAYVKCRCNTDRCKDLGALMTGVAFTGVTENFYGTIEAEFNSTVQIGNFGLPHGKLRATTANSIIENIASGAKRTFIKSVSLEAGSALKLSADAELSVGELNMAAGSVIDCSSFSGTPSVGYGLVLTNAFTHDDEKIVLDFKGQSLSSALKTIGLVAIDKKIATVTIDSFQLQNFVDTESEVSIQTVGNLQILSVTNPEYDLMPALPSTFEKKTGYVTLTATETASTVSGNNYSFYEKGLWSDGRAPHAGTNYVVGANQELWMPAGDAGEFRGDRVVVTADGVIRFNSAVQASYYDLCLLGGAKFVAGTQAALHDVGGGSLYVYGTTGNPSVILGGVTGQRYIYSGTLVGSSSRAIRAASSGTYINEKWSEVDFTGDSSNYRGHLIVDTNMTVRISGAGMPRATIDILGDYTTFGTTNAAGQVTSVKNINFATIVDDESGLAAIDLEANSTLAVNTLTIEGHLAVSGKGTLRIDNAVQLGASGSDIEIREGGLGVLTSYALAGIPLTFGNGTTLHVPFQTDDAELAMYGFKKTQTIQLQGVLNIQIDLNGAEMPADRIACVNFLTVSDDLADIYRQCLGELHAPWAGGKTSLVETSKDGLTTFAMKIQPNGFGVLFE